MSKEKNRPSNMQVSPCPNLRLMSTRGKNRRKKNNKKRPYLMHSTVMSINSKKHKIQIKMMTQLTLSVPISNKDYVKKERNVSTLMI